jgi:(1->4)-alpha-D-glucan 1-alpha-D-glucosylmutase
LLALSTHDSKRSRDVRARIGVLAGMVGEWREHVVRWRECNAGLRSGPAPDAIEEYWIYQTLVGAWPISAKRLDAHMLKTLREAKRNTNWAQPDEDWEAAVRRFVRGILEHAPFLEDFEPFAGRVALEGERVALGMLLLQLTSPGVPDIYQGDELARLVLVDPDNRSPVDFELRQEQLRHGADRRMGLIRAALALRARIPEAFAGAYTPLPAGPAVCAFLRGEAQVLVAVRVRPNGGSTLVLPGEACGQWRDVLSGRVWELERLVTLGPLLEESDRALLERV